MRPSRRRADIRPTPTNDPDAQGTRGARKESLGLIKALGDWYRKVQEGGDVCTMEARHHERDAPDPLVPALAWTNRGGIGVESWAGAGACEL